MRLGLRVVSVFIFFLGLSVGYTKNVAAQNCGSVNVECGERVCSDPRPDGSCPYGVPYDCLGGYGYDEPVECYASGGQCKLPEVCAAYGYCTSVVYGSCGGSSSGGGGGGAYQFPTCPGGTSLSCGTPALYVQNASGDLDKSGGQCQNRRECGDN